MRLLERMLAMSSAVAALAVAGAQPRYALTDLGTFGGTYSSSSAINTSGQVAGVAARVGADSRAFLYSGGQMHDLGTLGGGAAWAYGINDAGVVVGTSLISGNTVSHAFLYNGTTMLDLGSGTLESAAIDVNASGWVVGGAATGYLSNGYAFLYDSSGMHNLGTLGGSNSGASGINTSGQVVGDSLLTGDAVDHAFLYDGSMHDLGTLGGTNSKAVAINDSGQIAGTSDVAGNTTSHAFLYFGSVMYDLGDIGGLGSGALGINRSGQVVGLYYPISGAGRGFLYSNSVMVDVTGLLDSTGIGWTVNEATGINDSGQISGVGINPAGNPHAILLNPIRTVAGTVNLQSYLASAVAGTLVTVEIRSPGTTNSLDTHVVHLDASGNFSFTTNVPAGSYDIAIKASHWLRKAMYSENIGMYGVSGVNCSLINGDVNGDNVVSLADFGQLRAAFGSSSGASNWNPNADLNGDGVVSLADFGILRANFGRQGDP